MTIIRGLSSKSGNFQSHTIARLNEFRHTDCNMPTISQNGKPAEINIFVPQINIYYSFQFAGRQSESAISDVDESYHLCNDVPFDVDTDSDLVSFSFDIFIASRLL